MKKQILLIAALFLTTWATAQAQTQQGYVKTKGRMVNGQIVHGQGLKGATVSIKGRTAVLVNADDGSFSFPVPGAQFRIDSVRKKGYQLVDLDALSKTYEHSANPLYLVMETPEQQMEDQIDNFNKINASQQVIINNLRAEVKQLKEQNKINEEEYSKRLIEIAQMQSESQNLVNEMAERYSKIDFDQLDEFNQQVSWFILNGELIKADSLIKSKGDMDERSAELDRIHNANAEEEAKLEQSKKYEAKALEDFATDCFNLYEICKLKHEFDSAAYWLELRASKDTTNVKWLLSTGNFLLYYAIDLDKAQLYFEKQLRQSIMQYGNESPETADSYNSLGAIYTAKGDYSTALEYYHKCYALLNSDAVNNPHMLLLCLNNMGECYRLIGDYKNAIHYTETTIAIITETNADENYELSEAYNNLGGIYYSQNEFDKSLEYLEKALYLKKTYFPENKESLATCYNNLSMVYLKKLNADKAMEYSTNALSIQKELFGEIHYAVAITYSNLGLIHAFLHNYDDALEAYYHSISIRQQLFGETHVSLGLPYNNTGAAYFGKGDYDEALTMYNKALSIWKSNLKENHPNIALVYNNLGQVYNEMGDYQTAISYLDQALRISLEVYGENNIDAANKYKNLGYAYYNLGNYEKAAEYYQLGFNIVSSQLPENDPLYSIIQEHLDKALAKLKEQENEQKTEE